MLIKKTLLNLPAQLLAPLSQFVSIVAWTYLADHETIGTVTLITSSQELFNAVALLWWTHFVMRHYHEYAASGELPRLLATSRAVVLIVAILQGVLALINLYFFVDPDAAVSLAAAVTGFVAFRCVNQYLCVMAATRVSALDNTVHTLCGPFFGLGFGLLLLHFFGPAPLWPILGYLCGELIGLCYAFYKVEGNPFRFRMDATILKRAIRYGGPMPAQGMLSWASINLSRYLVNWQFGLATAGSFAVGFGLGQRAGSMAAMAVTVVSLPLAIKRQHAGGTGEGMLQLADNSVLLLAVMLPALVGLQLVSHDLIPLILAREYHDSALNILPWSLLSGGLVAYTSHYLNHAFFLHKKTGALPLIELVVVVFTYLLALFLLPRFGLVGGVMAVALPKLVQVVCLMGSLPAWMGLIIPWRRYIKLSIATACMAIVVLAIPGGGLIALVSKVAAGGFAYLAASALLFYREFNVKKHPL